MNHRRQQRLRKVEPKRPDTPMMLAAYEQNTEHWMDWRHRTVTLRTATAMVADGLAISLTRKYKGKLVTIYRELHPLRPALPTPCTLTMSTMHAAAANQPGARLTRGEQAHIAKLACWPFIPVPANCPTIRPKVGQREINQYNALMRRADGPQARPREFRSKSRVQAVHYSDQTAA